MSPKVLRQVYCTLNDPCRAFTNNRNTAKGVPDALKGEVHRTFASQEGLPDFRPVAILTLGELLNKADVTSLLDLLLEKNLSTEQVEIQIQNFHTYFLMYF